MSNHNASLFGKLAVIVAVLAIAGSAGADPVRRHARPIPGQFMVLLSPRVKTDSYDRVAASLVATYTFNILTEWREQPLGFLATNLTARDVERMSDDSRVSLIEENFAIPIVSGTQTSSFNGEYLWNLDRIDKTSEALANNTYRMCPEGTSVYAYVIDWGVRRDHEQFRNPDGSSRVRLSRAFDDNTAAGYADTADGCVGTPNGTTNGWHGTAVASVLAGRDVGASHANIVSLRVFPCNGNGAASYVINAVRWIRSAMDPYAASPGIVNYSGAVPGWVQMDFGNLNLAVDALVRNKNIPFFTSADNYSGDACQFSPNALAYTNLAHGRTVFTVGATSLGVGPTTNNDYRWQEWGTGGALLGPNGGSNGGSCVSIYAPGCAIFAARNDTATAYTPTNPRPSGTSFASPLAAGVAARYIERFAPSQWYQVYDYLLSSAFSTGAPLYNFPTPEYWMCLPTNGGQPYTSRTAIATCPAGYYGGFQPPTSTPIHFASQSNSSNANILYSGGLTCP